jgi:hypothetical protein
MKSVGRKHVGIYARWALYVVAIFALMAPVMEREPHKKVGAFYMKHWGKHVQDTTKKN